MMSNAPRFGRDPEFPKWSLIVIASAVGLALLLFSVIALANVSRRSNDDSLRLMHDLDIVALPPLPEFVDEPLEQPLPEPQTPPAVAVAVPQSPARWRPSRVAPTPTFDLPSFSEGMAYGLNAVEWEIDPGVFAMTEVDAPPRPIVQVPPLYPAMARQGGIEGRVEIVFVVGRDGAVRDVHVAASEPGTLFVSAARDAVARWRFEPARRGGEKVAVRVRVPLEFRIAR